MTEGDQKSLDGERGDVGIKCFVRCTSNKVDQAKEDVRSINLNFDIRVGDELVGKGNNLNINNLSPEGYANLCKAFGVDRIDERTPFFAELMTLGASERKRDWEVAFARKDGSVDKDQGDITRDPALISAKQEKFSMDMVGKKLGGDEILKEFLAEKEVEEISALDKAAASELIEILQETADKPEENTENMPPAKSKPISGEPKEKKKPAKKKAAKKK